MGLTMPGDPRFMQMAIDLATENVVSGRGGPFGAVLVRHGEVIAAGANEVTATNDPTAHAEVVTIRRACQEIGSFQLTGCEMYTSCEPCPMCLAAIYWAQCARIYYGNCAVDAAEAGFADAHLYAEIRKSMDERAIPTERLLSDRARASFDAWKTSEQRVDY